MTVGLCSCLYCCLSSQVPASDAIGTALLLLLVQVLLPCAFIASRALFRALLCAQLSGSNTHGAYTSSLPTTSQPCTKQVLGVLLLYLFVSAMQHAQIASGSGFDAQSMLLRIFRSYFADALFPITAPVSSKHLHKAIVLGNSAAKLAQALACRLQSGFDSEQGPQQQALYRQEDWCAAKKETKWWQCRARYAFCPAVSPVHTGTLHDATHQTHVSYSRTYLPVCTCVAFQLHHCSILNLPQMPASKLIWVVGLHFPCCAVLY